MSKEELYDALRELAGYVENGTSVVVSFGEDDASREWFLRVGKRTYYARTLGLAIELAKAAS